MTGGVLDSSVQSDSVATVATNDGSRSADSGQIRMIDMMVDNMNLLLLRRHNRRSGSRRRDHDNLLAAIVGESVALHLVGLADLMSTLDSVMLDLLIERGVSDR